MGEILRVIGGPICTTIGPNISRWFEIENGSGETGWVVETLENANSPNPTYYSFEPVTSLAM
jgi:hypothetical protein